MDNYKRAVALRENPPSSFEEIKRQLPDLAKGCSNLEEFLIVMCLKNKLNVIQCTRPAYGQNGRTAAANVVNKLIRDSLYLALNIEILRILFTSYGLRYEDVQVEKVPFRNLLDVAIVHADPTMVRLLKSDAHLQDLTEEEMKNAITHVVKTRHTHMLTPLCQNWNFATESVQNHALSVISQKVGEADETLLLREIVNKLGITRANVSPEVLHEAAARKKLYMLKFLKETFNVGAEEFGRESKAHIGPIIGNNTDANVRYIVENYFPREWVNSLEFVNACVARSDAGLLEMLKPVFGITDELVRARREDCCVPLLAAFQNSKCVEMPSKFLRLFNYTAEDMSDADILAILFSAQSTGNDESLKTLVDHFPHLKERIPASPLPEGLELPPVGTRQITKLVELLFVSDKLSSTFLLELINVFDLKLEHFPKKGFVAVSYLLGKKLNLQNLEVMQEVLKFRFGDLTEEEKKELLLIVVREVAEDVPVLKMFQTTGFVPSELAVETKAALKAAIEEVKAIDVALYFKQRGVDLKVYQD